MSKTRPQPRSLPASYVVRLYRRDPARLDAVAGLIEDVDAGRTTSFRSGTELLCRLHGVDGPAPAVAAPAAPAVVDDRDARASPTPPEGDQR